MVKKDIIKWGFRNKDFKRKNNWREGWNREKFRCSTEILWGIWKWEIEILRKIFQDFWSGKFFVLKWLWFRTDWHNNKIHRKNKM